MAGLLENRRVLVTGAAGFLGAATVRLLLQEGARVHAVVRGATTPGLDQLGPRVSLHLADLRDAAAVGRVFGESRPELVLHLAASGGHTGARGPAWILENNVGATLVVLEASVRSGVQRFVQVGSSLEYGRRDRAFVEEDRLEPDCLFGWAKAAASQLVLGVWRERGFPAVVLRPFSIYGPGEGAHRLIPTAIHACLQGKPLPLTGPDCRRDFVYVDDVARACLLAATCNRVEGQSFNISSGKQFSNLEVVRRVEALIGKPLELRVGEYPQRATDRAVWIGDNARARESLDWSPRFDLDAGLRRTIDWTCETLAETDGCRSSEGGSRAAPGAEP